MLEAALALAVPNEVSRPHLRTAPAQVRPRLRTECDHSPPHMRRMSNPRQSFRETLHPQPLFADVRSTDEVIGLSIAADAMRVDVNNHLDAPGRETQRVRGRMFRVA